MTARAQSAPAPISAGKAKRPPKLKGGLPLIGHTLDFVRDTIGLLQRTHDECGKAGRFKLLGKDMILFTGPEAHEALFRLPDEVLSPNAAYKMMVPVFGEGVAYGAESSLLHRCVLLFL